MFKGYRRKVVVIKNPSSKLFDSAYFVLREGRDDSVMRDMVEEASKIIEENSVTGKHAVSAKRFFSFSLGFALASIIFAVSVFFISYI